MDFTKGLLFLSCLLSVCSPLPDWNIATFYGYYIEGYIDIHGALILFLRIPMDSHILFQSIIANQYSWRLTMVFKHSVLLDISFGFKTTFRRSHGLSCSLQVPCFIVRHAVCLCVLILTQSSLILHILWSWSRLGFSLGGPDYNTDKQKHNDGALPATCPIKFLAAREE